MIPHYTLDVDATLPPGFAFWVPTRSEVDEAIENDAGLGFFHETWLLGEVSRQDASAVIEQEAAILAAIHGLAHDEEEFEKLAGAVESSARQDVDGDFLRRPGWPALDEEFPTDEPTMSCLELGVGAGAYAMAAVGLVPVASCRSHAELSWSHAPVVFVATDRPRAVVLQRLVARHGCGLNVDNERPQFLTVTAPDLHTMIELARSLLDAADEFGPGSVVTEPDDDQTGAEVDPDQIELFDVPSDADHS